MPSRYNKKYGRKINSIIQTKALKINLDNTIYGSMVEIGFGQEVGVNSLEQVQHQEQLKTMSAYDKDFSDAIYGKEKMVDMFVSLD